MTDAIAHASRRACGERISLWLHRYAILLAGMTLLLIVAGGMVTSTGSGLAVPDWPTTYQQNMFTFPYSKWVGGIFYEHGHRLIASTVGFLTIVLALWLQVCEPRRWLRRLGWSALLLVILQGVLGGLTVIYLLPTPISVFHGCLAQIFFCVVLAIALFTSRWWQRATPVSSEGRCSIRFLATCMTLVVFAQLVLGAILRHTESGLAIPDFPLAYGSIAPSLSPEAVERYNHDRRWVHQLPEVSVAQIAAHLAHRAGAVLVAAVALCTCVIALRRHSRVVPLRNTAMLALLLLAAQIVLGAYTIWLQKAPIIATAHVAVGAALLGVAWMQTLVSARCLSYSPASTLPAGAWVQAA